MQEDKGRIADPTAHRYCPHEQLAAEYCAGAECSANGRSPLDKNGAIGGDRNRIDRFRQ